MGGFPETVTVSAILAVVAVHTPRDGNLSFSNRHAHALVFYTRGQCEYTFPYKRFVARDGEIIFLPQGGNYSIAPDGESDCLVINFRSEALNGYRAFSVEPSEPVNARAVFEKCFNVWLQRETGYAAKCMSYLYGVLSSLQRDLLSPGGALAHGLNKAVAYIHRHYTECDLNLEALVKVTGVSERTFRNQFRKRFGMSPIKYIIQLRMILASELVSSQFFTVSEVAEKCGFSDVYYFSRLFKEYYGAPPSRYGRQP